MCAYANNYTLPEVSNLSKLFVAIPELAKQVAKQKGTSVYFDREKLTFVGITEAVLKQLKETYVGVDVDAELKKMGIWLTSPKGKTRKGNIGFVLNWLNNAVTSLPVEEQLKIIEQDTPLRPLINEYLKDLWKGREHLLELNTSTKKT